MKTTALGSLDVSVVGLGCNNFGRALDQDGTSEVVAAALDAGITFFDTASNYGEGRSEGLLGHALGTRRDEVVIATKFGVPVPGVEGSGGARPDYVRSSVERSLRELNTDRIDLLQLHFPDPETPIEDTLAVLEDLVAEGKVIEIGCSNFDAALLEEAFAASRDGGYPKFVSNQIEYSIIERGPESDGLVDVAISESMALLPFYPLANGLLTGKKRPGEQVEGRLNMDRYQSYLTDRNFAVVDAVRTCATELGVSMPSYSIAWLLAQQTVPSVTPGATRPEQVAGNVEAAAIELTAGDLARLDRLLAEIPVTAIDETTADPR
jgi:aryl-alcohol dehydrogenase-like predicted oxidoreductase